MKKLTTLLFIAALSLAGQAQNNRDTKPYIEVTGTAEQSVLPDEIYIRIMIRERHVNKEKITIEVQEEKLKAALREIGIDLANLTVSDANADYVKISWKSKDVITLKEYVLKVRTARQVGDVFQQLDRIDITDASIARVDHSRIDSLKKEVRILAIRAAKDKADYLLNAIGQKTGPALIVQEKENGSFDASLLNVRGSRSTSTQYYVDGQRVAGNDLQFEKLRIQSAIYVKFEIQ